MPSNSEHNPPLALSHSSVFLTHIAREPQALFVVSKFYPNQRKEARQLFLSPKPPTNMFCLNIEAITVGSW